MATNPTPNQPNQATAEFRRSEYLAWAAQWSQIHLSLVEEAKQLELLVHPRYAVSTLSIDGTQIAPHLAAGPSEDKR